MNVQCKCKNCQAEFTAKVADRKRGWAKCCSKACAAQLREHKTGAFKQMIERRDCSETATFSNAHQFDNCEQ